MSDIFLNRVRIKLTAGERFIINTLNSRRLKFVEGQYEIRVAFKESDQQIILEPGMTIEAEENITKALFYSRADQEIVLMYGTAKIVNETFKNLSPYRMTVTQQTIAAAGNYAISENLARKSIVLRAHNGSDDLQIRTALGTAGFSIVADNNLMLENTGSFYVYNAGAGNNTISILEESYLSDGREKHQANNSVTVI